MSESSDYETHLQQELNEFRQEQDRVRRVLGRVGGKSQAKIDMAINMGILGVILLLFVIETFTEWIPTLLSLEIGILLISVKIVWMIHTNARAYHFQFWVLNSLEFRLNEVTKTTRRLEHRLSELQDGLQASGTKTEEPKSDKTKTEEPR